MEISFSPKLAPVKTENVANLTSVKFQNAPKIRHFPTEILILHQKKGQNFSAAFGGRGFFSYVRGIYETPNSYPRDILKNPKSYVRTGTRGEKKKKTHALADFASK